MIDITPFAVTLEEWYEQHKRELPWRSTRNPYEIWVSEIILQQTRVVQGYDYYVRFLRAFPTVEALAAAQEEEVMRLWQGLGYYSRARNLYAAAKSVVRMGHFPSTYKEILALKGVGPYTAAAIASFAFHLPYAVVDGNVYRVLSRYFGIDEAIDTPQGQRTFRTMADEMLDVAHPALYNQAIMDFGALQCVPQSPVCDVCPLCTDCVAFREGRVAELPVKGKALVRRDRYFVYLYIKCTGAMMIHRRVARDIWNGLFEVPLLESPERTLSLEEVRQSSFMQEIRSRYAGGGDGGEMWRCVCRGVKHVLSHRNLYADFYEVDLSDVFTVSPGDEWLIGGEVYRWISEGERGDFAFPRLILRLFEHFSD
jgi:A/G-specific adenine glycosylase